MEPPAPAAVLIVAEAAVVRSVLVVVFLLLLLRLSHGLEHLVLVVVAGPLAFELAASEVLPPVLLHTLLVTGPHH